MSFENARNLIFCAECKTIHNAKMHSIEPENKKLTKIAPMTTEAIQKYINSPLWLNRGKQDGETMLGRIQKFIHPSPKSKETIKT